VLVENPADPQTRSTLLLPRILTLNLERPFI
jgi:hypothetical protein